MSSSRSRLRPLLARLAAWRNDPAEARAMIGDFDEHFARTLRERGRSRAELVYLRELLLALLWSLRDAGATDASGPGARDLSTESSPGFFTMLLQDLRYALRSLSQRWSTTTIAIAVIALGVGLNVAMFTVVRATILSPFPFPEPERLRVLFGTYEAQGWDRAALSIPELNDHAERSSLIDEVGITRGGVRMSLVRDDRAERVVATFATSAYFRALEVPPLTGRTFLPEEDIGPGAHPVVVLSHGFWQARLAGRPGVVGTSLRLSGRDYEVVGVMPPGLVDVANGFEATDVWVPLTMGRPFLGQAMFETRSNRQYVGLVRLADGVSPEDVQAELDRIALELGEQFPATHEQRGVTAWRLGDFFFGSLREPLRLLLVGAALVLLICSVNVGAMLLVQTRGRRTEIAVRAALGARRADLVRQLLSESLLLAAAGGGLGVLLASWTVAAARSSYALPLPAFANVRLDSAVLAATAVLVVGAGALFGLVPALRFTRPETTAALSESGARGATPRRYGWPIVVMEAAVAALLLVGAGLAAKDLAALADTPTGYRVDGVLTARFDLTRGTDTPEDADAAREVNNRRALARIAFAEELLERARALPGVEAVGMIGPNVLGNANWHVRLVPPGREGAEPSSWPTGQRLLVTPGTLEAAGLRLIEGRDFTTDDRPGAEPVALIDRRLAESFFGDEDPIGRTLVTGSDGTGPRIVGIVEPARHRGRLTPDSVVAGDVYFPYLQQPWTRVSAILRVRTEEPGVMDGLRRTVAEIEPDAVMDDVAWMADRLRRAESTPRLVATLASTYAAIAGLLAFVGTYGVLAYSVHSRAREIAVRSALGSSRRRILRQVLAQGLMPALAGIAAGLAAALALTGPMGAILSSVGALDPLVYGAVALLLLVASAAACWIPARRAARIDPMQTLRSEQ